jgi:hypothetical protein
VTFTLPLGKRRGPQNSVRLNLDTDKQGAYRLSLTQSDGVEHEIPITILPPNPKISNHPVRVNLGEPHQAIHFQGSGMQRIEAVSSNAGEITGKRDANGWSGEIALKTGLVKGQIYPVLLKVKGLDNSVTVPDVIEIVGPRPKIRSVQKSLPGTLGIDSSRCNADCTWISVCRRFTQRNQDCRRNRIATTTTAARSQWHTGLSEWGISGATGGMTDIPYAPPSIVERGRYGWDFACPVKLL